MTTPNSQVRTGVTNAVSSYVMWGFAPIYFKLLHDINASEILIHRVIWSCLLLAIIIVLANKWRFVQVIAKQPKLLFRLTITATILAVNWFLFIWAINNDHLLDASLGYFINPLFSVALGVIFLGERLRKWQKFAVFLAMLGVLIQLIILGSLPLISLALAGTFGTYGLLRKKMAVDSFVGLWFESLLMVPFAVLYWLFFTESASSNMFANTLHLNVILILAGVVTTAPLLCFTAAAKRLTLSALGFFQYIGPSIMFVLATFLYHEPLLDAKLATFALIWLALAVFSIDSWRARKALKST
ncbi:MAG: protein RarD [Gammaproteobacteria bacterium]|nr:MAG: protein RarD [Gammaproteobacteria bacterium]